MRPRRAVLSHYWKWAISHRLGDRCGARRLWVNVEPVPLCVEARVETLDLLQPGGQRDDASCSCSSHVRWFHVFLSLIGRWDRLADGDDVVFVDLHACTPVLRESGPVTVVCVGGKCPTPTHGLCCVGVLRLSF